jgi:hypothetical protein
MLSSNEATAVAMYGSLGRWCPRTLALWALSIVAGCAPTILVSGVPVHEDQWYATVASLERRASRDLDCPAERLDWSLYERRGKVPHRVGATGCGRSQIYLGSHQQGWIHEPVASAGVATAPGGPGIVVVDGIEVYQRIWDETRAVLIPMAERELQCPQSDLALSLQRKAGRYPIDVVANGCGRSVLYSRRAAGNGLLGRWQSRGTPTGGSAMGTGGVAPAPTAPPPAQ